MHLNMEFQCVQTGWITGDCSSENVYVIYTTGNQLHWLNMEPNRLHRFLMHTWQVAHEIGQWGVFSPKDFFVRSECNSNKPDAAPIRNWNIAIVAVLTDFTNMTVMLSDLPRNQTFNRSAHCTQVSDQCPLGLLFTVHRKNRSFTVCINFKSMYR